MDDAALAALRKLKPAWCDRPIDRIEYLSGGYTNRNYRLELGADTYVLRVVESREARPSERRYLDISAAPDVVAYDAGTGHLLTRWIDGQLLAQSPPTPAAAGAYLADLHGQIPTGLARYDYQNTIARMLDRAKRVDPVVLERFESDAWVAAGLRGCHNDLNPWNIIFTRTPEGPAYRTLDWESAGDNDPLFDLVGLCLGLDWGLDEAWACIEAYRASGEAMLATPARLRQTFRAFLVREYAWAVAQLAIGNDRPEVAEQAAASSQALAAWV